MKKIVSLMALCMVLLGAVMMVTGCGSKPKTGTVWEVTAGIPDAMKNLLGKDAGVYLCFHTNGQAYSATKVPGMLRAEVLGEYKIEKETITIGKESVKYTLKKDTMTVKAFKMGSVKVDLELKMVSTPSEAEIAKAAK